MKGDRSRDRGATNFIDPISDFNIEPAPRLVPGRATIDLQRGEDRVMIRIAMSLTMVLAGSLTALAGTAGCVREDGTGGACTDGVAIDLVEDLALTRNGRNLYAVTGNSGEIAIFSRD